MTKITLDHLEGDEFLFKKIYADEFYDSDGKIINPSGLTTDDIIYSEEHSHINTLQDVISHVWSIGACGDGFNITEIGDGSVDVTAGSVVLRSEDTKHGDLRGYAVAGVTGMTFTDETTSAIYVDYNAGTPILTSTDNLSSVLDDNTKALVWVINRLGNELNIVDIRSYNVDYPRKNAIKDFRVNDVEHASGAFVADKGSLKFSITEGMFYLLNNELITPAIDTSVADTFTYVYRDGVGGHTRVTGQTDVDNLQYDDGSGTLASVGVAKFSNTYIYVVHNQPAHYVAVYGTEFFNTLADAQAATLPIDLPSDLDTGSTGRLIGVVITNQAATPFEDILSPFTDVLQSATPVNHNELSGIQGGAVDDYQHLTGTQLTALTTGVNADAQHEHDIAGFSDDVNDMFGTIDGLAFDKPAFTTVDDTGLQLDVENILGGDMRFFIEGTKATLDCTTGAGAAGKARVALTAGSDANNPVTNYIYVDQAAGVATLKSSTTLPTGAFAWVGKIVVPDATTWATTGEYLIQRYTEAFTNDSRGTSSHEREKLRALGAVYINGGSHTLDITAGPPDTVHLQVSQAEIYQLHRQTFPQTLTGPYYYGNGSDIYEQFAHLGLAARLDDGTAITNGRTYNVVIWGAVNYESGDCKLFANMPTAEYISSSQAIDDRDNTADYSVPEDMRSVAFMIARVVMTYNTGGTFTEQGTFSLLGQPVGVRAGGGASVASNVFDDSLFRVFDNGDSTKQIALEADQITTATTRTITMADNDVDLGKMATRINTDTYATSQTLTVTQCLGYTIYVTGAATITLPAIEDGLSVTIITIGAVAVSVDPNASDKIWLDGVALDDGDKITNGSAAGDIAVLTYYSADGWHASTNGWTDGGA